MVQGTSGTSHFGQHPITVVSGATGRVPPLLSSVSVGLLSDAERCASAGDNKRRK
jgi:hypothetical protein